MQQTVQHRDNTMSTLKDAKAYSTHRRLEIQYLYNMTFGGSNADKS